MNEIHFQGSREIHPPASRDERGGLDPKVACRDKWRRVEALKRVKAFLNACRQAWAELKRGDVVFPAGTYSMCRHAGCPVTPLRRLSGARLLPKRPPASDRNLGEARKRLR